MAGFEFTKYVTYEDNGNIIAIRGLNCKNGSLDLRDVKYIDNSDFSKLSRSKLYTGDILYTYVGTVGEVAVVDKNDKYYLAPNVSRIRLSKDYNSDFIKQLLGSKKFYNQIVFPLIATSSQPALSMENLRKFKLKVPSIREQTKIASLLNAIDERIATQNKIIDKLQSLIKGIAQKIVRSNKPNVRLYECVECSSSTQQESEVCEQGAYPVYGANGIVGYLDDYNTEGEAVYIIKDGSGVGTVSYVTGKCSATGTLNTLQAKDGYSLQYLYYLLKLFNFEPYKTGMAIPHIYFKDYGKAKVFCPSYTEQLQYARLLSAIDSKLSVEKNTLRNLSLQKQYLLRQMFI
ncbi:restriction endonuclease subunit S [Bacteroides uniformis]|uniref:restriction endonuclease subunit S n=1 Tax=Bacteroides uniformis TaxID=820 RepID=UPI00201D9CD9|nr:restriction endonuclease subunit S [Bacteroides uniformis]QUT69089.1 Type I restriction modification DNA specificity domain protein [Bacteroides uniformis]